jgi:hypothetical protein
MYGNVFIIYCWGWFNIICVWIAAFHVYVIFGKSSLQPL